MLLLFASFVLLASACNKNTADTAAAAATSATAEGPQSADTDNNRPGDPAATVENVPLPETNYFEITTRLGRMVIRLYDETPGHRDNFKKLAAEGFFDGTRFHRVMNEFMIQGGDPLSKDDDPMNDGTGGPGYTIPAEFNTAFLHKKGALAAARQPDNVNPNKESSGSQFYIVHGRPFMSAEMDQIERQTRISFPDDVRAVYETVGGAPFLDMGYTVFGELVEGFDVLDAIATTPTPNSTQQRVHPALGDQPVEPIEMMVSPIAGYDEAQ